MMYVVVASSGEEDDLTLYQGKLCWGIATGYPTEQKAEEAGKAFPHHVISILHIIPDEANK